jgi:hypothetical protein
VFDIDVPIQIHYAELCKALDKALQQLKHSKATTSSSSRHDTSVDRYGDQHSPSTRNTSSKRHYHSSSASPTNTSSRKHIQSAVALSDSESDTGNNRHNNSSATTSRYKSHRR